MPIGGSGVPARSWDYNARGNIAKEDYETRIRVIRHGPGEWRMRQDRAGDGTRQARGALIVRQAVAEVVDDDADRHPFPGLTRGRRGGEYQQEEQGDADHQRVPIKVSASGKWRCP